MRAFTLLVLAAGAAAGLLVGGACSDESSHTSPTAADAGGSRWDSAPVAPSEGGGPLVDAGPGLTPSCEKYCSLVMANCTGDDAQYASEEECLAFCAHLPLDPPSSEGEAKSSASVACRQYWADSPARTDPKTYCLAAGPFGGNVCGDRCTAFCTVVLAACSPDGGTPVYASQPECATACAGLSYREPNADGGGEGPHGPASGDTLNCRLYYLRHAASDPKACKSLLPDAGKCQ
jgi:hypothetical protein